MLMLSISRLGQVIMDTVRYVLHRKLYCLPAPDGRQQRKVSFDETLTGYHAQISGTLPRYYMHCLRVLAAKFAKKKGSFPKRNVHQIGEKILKLFKILR